MNGFVVSVDFGNQHWRIPRQIVNRAGVDIPVQTWGVPTPIRQLGIPRRNERGTFEWALPFKKGGDNDQST